MLALAAAALPALAQSAEPPATHGDAYVWFALAGMSAAAALAGLRHRRHRHYTDDAIPHHVVRDHLAGWHVDRR
jgi:hypothetical protein